MWKCIISMTIIFLIELRTSAKLQSNTLIVPSTSALKFDLKPAKIKPLPGKIGRNYGTVISAGTTRRKLMNNKPVSNRNDKYMQDNELWTQGSMDYIFYKTKENSFSFSVSAKSDAILGFAAEPSKDKILCDMKIGFENLASIVNCAGETLLEVLTPEILSSEEMREFSVSWNSEGFLTLANKDNDALIEIQNAKFTKIKFVGVRTASGIVGTWNIFAGNMITAKYVASSIAYNTTVKIFTTKQPAVTTNRIKLTLGSPTKRKPAIFNKNTLKPPSFFFPVPPILVWTTKNQFLIDNSNMKQATVKKFNTVKNVTLFDNRASISNNMRTSNLIKKTTPLIGNTEKFFSRVSVTSSLYNRTFNNEAKLTSNKLTIERKSTNHEAVSTSSKMQSFSLPSVTKEDTTTLSTEIVTVSTSVMQRIEIVATTKSWMPDLSLTKLNGRKYYFSDAAEDKTKTWHQAQDFCQQYGMNLVTIETSNENAAIAEKIKVLLHATMFDFFWIGLNDLDKEGEYRWISNNRSVDFTDWRDGEPNNMSNAEHCVRFSTKCFFVCLTDWNDEGCHIEGPFICEVP